LDVTRIIATLAATAAGAIALLMSLPATAAQTTVMAKVGPGYTISLTIGGKKVKTLKAGVKYRFVVADRSEDHDFRLVGPGTSKVLSGEEFTGTKTTVLRLRKGTHRFFCAPHSDEMRGGFKVA
jgi:plastocyanin